MLVRAAGEIAQGGPTRHLSALERRRDCRAPGAVARQPATWAQLGKFAAVGGSGYLINLAVFAALAGDLGIPHSAAALAAFLVAVTNNFFWKLLDVPGEAAVRPGSRRRVSSSSVSRRSRSISQSWRRWSRTGP